MILHKTEINNFVHYIVDGEQIVRNPRIHALIEAKLTGVSPQYRRILATPVFSGLGSSEVITWTTNVFQSPPQKMSSLSGDQYEHYKSILTTILGEFKSAMSSAPAKTKELIEAALTCHSEDNVYCADDNVVIAEWGMSPKGNSRENILLGMDYTPSKRPYSFQNEEMPEKIEDVNSESSDISQTDFQDTNGTNGIHEIIETNDNETETESEPVTNNDVINEEEENDNIVSDETPSSGGGSNHFPPSSDTNHSKKTWNLKWLWLLLLLLLLLLLGFGLFNSCKGPMAGISTETSPIDTTKIGLSDDSLTYEVKNRVILLIVDGGSVPDFVKAFREQYPDKEKYVLENPDTIIPRIVLTLPEEEKQSFIDGIRTQFPQFDIEVIPETMYKFDLMPNDPAMSDPVKRWYFDMCGVYDAWDVTMGDEDVVVAVIDDGFDLSHPEIKGKIVNPYNAVEHNSNIFFTDEHGTHVAATAVGEANNHNGIAGIAPNCKLMPIQVGDKNGMMTTSAILDGVLYAIAKGADVVNMSLGMSLGPFVQFIPVHIQKNIIANNFLSEQRVWDRIFEMAEAKNVTFVLSGGNDNVLIGIDPSKRSSKTIRVSAVQPDMFKADFSNYGDYSTLSAPGVEIYNAAPENNYESFDGTSMASPIVAGGVALLKSKNRNYTTRQITDILEQTGLSPLSDVGPIVNFANALQGKRTGGKESQCSEAAARYQELLKELENLRRNYPECIQEPDTMKIPVGADVQDLYGLWMSTTRLYNEQDQEVVIYFEFNGTSKGMLYLEEPDKKRYSATTSISVQNDVVYIDQDAEATNGIKSYNAYEFLFVPDRQRRAEGKGVNKTNASNKIDFKLVKIK